MYHSTLGWRVIKKRRRYPDASDGEDADESIEYVCTGVPRPQENKKKRS